jgi:hypothetical protein
MDVEWEVGLRHAPPGEVPSLRLPQTTAAPLAGHTRPPPPSSSRSVASEPGNRARKLARGHRSTGQGSYRGDTASSSSSNLAALALPPQPSRWVLVDDVITSQEVSHAAHRNRLSELSVRPHPSRRIAHRSSTPV